MSKINDGGPAFPVVTTHDTNNVCPGMSLRDWFAGQALAGLLHRSWDCADGTTPSDIFDLWARAAYSTADAMLRAREARHDEG